MIEVIITGMEKHIDEDNNEHEVILRRASITIRFLEVNERLSPPTDQEIGWFQERQKFLAKQVRVLMSKIWVFVLKKIRIKSPEQFQCYNLTEEMHTGYSWVLFSGFMVASFEMLLFADLIAGDLDHLIFSSWLWREKRRQCFRIIVCNILLLLSPSSTWDCSELFKSATCIVYIF